MALFVILFGLSMDYEVFLLSRIREEWLRTGENATSVADGLAVTGRIITAAAAIMFCVSLASFVIKDPLHILKLFGLGLATAVFVDATLVRMVLVPSIMELLGPVNWWMPRRIDRFMPKLGAEVTPTALAPARGRRCRTRLSTPAGAVPASGGAPIRGAGPAPAQATDPAQRRTRSRRPRSCP